MLLFHCSWSSLDEIPATQLWPQVIHLIDGVLLPAGESYDLTALPRGDLDALAVRSSAFAWMLCLLVTECRRVALRTGCTGIV